MTRKSGSKLLAANTKNTSSGTGGGAGYCEVCRVNYTWLEEHLSSVGHIKAVTDPTQYQELDSLITATGWLGGQRKSLRIRSPTPLHQSPPPPTILNCNGHQNSSSHQGLSNGLASRRSIDRKSPRRGRVVRKRLSAEEKLIEDNRAYYKVEVLNSKLRSTGTLQRQLGSSGSREEEEVGNTTGVQMGGILGASSLHNGQTSVTPSNPDSVVVRFKKVRRTELSTLNDEAENFMFGEKKDDMSADNSSESNQSEEVGRKKRRTHAELFINDNADYYKFELPGSRLRYQGTTLAHVPTPGKDDSNHSRFKLSKSPPYDDLVLPRLRSAGKSPPTPREELVNLRPRSTRSPVDEDHPCQRLRSLRSPAEEEPSYRLRSVKSPVEEELSIHRTRSGRSPTEEESLSHHRLRSSARSPSNDEPSVQHRLRSGGRSPTDEEAFNHPRSRSRGRSPTEEEASAQHRLRSGGRSPVEYEPIHHHRLRSGGRSPAEEDHHQRSNRCLDEDSWGHHHRLRSTRNYFDDEDSSKARGSPEVTLPKLRSSGTPPPTEPKLRSCPGLSPIKENMVQRVWLPSEDDPAPELTLSHTDITFAFELNNTEGVWSQVQDRLDNYQEELLPRYFTYPNVVLPCEMPYLERLKLLTRRRRRISRCLDDKPRKSPRCHASTLAIMSSILPKTKSGDQPCLGSGSTTTASSSTAVSSPAPPTEPSAAEDEDTTTSSLTAESTLSDPNNDSKALLQRYMQHFLSLLEGTTSKVGLDHHLEPVEDAVEDVHLDNQDFLAMLENNDCPTMDMYLQEAVFNIRSFDPPALDSCNSSDCSEIFGFSEDGRSYFGRRKKKKRHNLTGWPKEKPRRKFMAYAKKPRFIKSEPTMADLDPDTESSAIVENFVLSLAEMRSGISPTKKKRGRPRLYPPGMSPSSLKVKLARENALRRCSSVSPLKLRPSLKAHPL